MRSLVLAHQKERFAFVSSIKPVNRLLCRQVSGITFEALFTTIHLNKDGVVVVALARKNFPVIKSSRICFEVPFPNHRRFIASRLQ